MTAGPPQDKAARLHRWLAITIAVLMAADAAIIIYEGQWMNAFLVLAIMAVVLAPTLLRDRLPVRLSAELLILTLVFSFAALFLGEIRSYYARIWWWDIALHVTSGLLLGILGFLLVYILNENRRINLHMRPRFVALFAFVFAVAVGALWEIFEFAMDQIFGLNMQKPMLGDVSGLTDTMWDLIVDAIGALAISLYGLRYMRRRSKSFIDRWIEEFIASNPRLFQ